ncbi:MAG: sigma-70 family RNA polymerase sigma factor [Actinobacteria bacterium]|nr:MAG: sigma-70 family RNA polymerase sigma factor [Actinomycetota bacterium]
MAVAERILHLQPDTDTRPDRALVHEAQHGREEAATVLYQRYYPRIYSFVSHLTYGRANAEDLTQEVFVRALKALGRFNGQYRFEHWLLRIAKNLCIDEARRNVRQPALTDPRELPELEGIPAPDYVWESVSRDMVATVVHRALQALPSRQRTVLVMREMEGMSYADIAQVVGTNPRGVEATLRRARARFRLEVSRAESAEVARATCRRVLRLVGDDPQASRSEEAAAHLAHCADCRRQARLGVDGRPSVASRAFGFFPPLFGLGRLAALFRPSAVAPSIRRVSDRARDALALAGPGSSALAAPIVRMAEVAGGVLVATVVTMSPTLTTTAQPVGTTVATASEAAAPAQVESVPSTSLLFRASPNSPVTAGPATAAQPSTPALTTPSLLGASPSGAGPLDVLSQLGLAPGGDVVASALTNVSSVSNILADQLNQVAQLTNSTLDNLTGPLGTGAQTLTTPVNELTNGVIRGVGNTVRGVGTELSTGLRSPATSPPVTSSAVPSPTPTGEP